MLLRTGQPLRPRDEVLDGCFHFTIILVGGGLLFGTSNHDDDTGIARGQAVQRTSTVTTKVALLLIATLSPDFECLESPLNVHQIRSRVDLVTGELGA